MTFPEFLPLPDTISVRIKSLSLFTDSDSSVLHTKPIMITRRRRRTPRFVRMRIRSGLLHHKLDMTLDPTLGRIMLGNIRSQAVAFPDQLVLFLPHHLPLSLECLMGGLFEEIAAIPRAEYLAVLLTEARLVGNPYGALFH